MRFDLRALPLALAAAGGLLTLGCSTDSSPNVSRSGGDPGATTILIEAVPPLHDGTSYTLKAKLASGATAAFSWTASAGSIDNSGTFTAPSAAGEVTITAALVSDPGVRGTTTVTVRKVAVAIDPATAILAPGESKAFTASVTGNGTESSAVTFTAAGGAVTTAGVYTAPATDGTYLVQATSVADTRKTATAAITVGGSVSVAVAPGNATVELGGTQAFLATVSGTSVKDVIWSANGGTISQAGVYTATKSGIFTIRATSKKDPSKFGEVGITVQDVVVTVIPGTANAKAGETVQFLASVAGTADKRVFWSSDNGGVISQAGVFTATKAGNFTVTALSLADPTRTGTARLSVDASGWTPGGSTTLHAMLQGASGALKDGKGTMNFTIKATFAPPSASTRTARASGALPAPLLAGEIVDFEVDGTYELDGQTYVVAGTGTFDCDSTASVGNATVNGVQYTFQAGYDPNVGTIGGMAGTFTEVGATTPSKIEMVAPYVETTFLSWTPTGETTVQGELSAGPGELEGGSGTLAMTIKATPPAHALGWALPATQDPNIVPFTATGSFRASNVTYQVLASGNCDTRTLQALGTATLNQKNYKFTAKYDRYLGTTGGIRATFTPVNPATGSTVNGTLLF